MKKIISLVSAAVLSAALLLPQATALSAAAEADVLDSAADMVMPAANGVADTLPYQLRFVPERNFVTADEVAAGDVVIPAAVYLTGSIGNTFGSAMVKYGAYQNGEKTSSVYFQDLVTGDSAHKTAAEQTYESSRGSFTTDFVPYCFGAVAGKNNKYSSKSPMFTTKEYACDPIFGSTLTSAGNGKITFRASFYTNAEDRKNGAAKTSQDFTCDVTLDENGNGVYSYNYIDQSTFQTVTKTAVIPRYQPNTPEGEKIPDSCDSVMWIAGSSQLKDGASFFGTPSDEFPLFQVNIVIEKGTAPGIYDIRFLEDSDVTAGENPCQLLNSKNQEVITKLAGTSIAVGVENVTVTQTVQDEAAFYTADNTRAIRAADFAEQILADVTYSDQTTDSDVNITNLVDCYGTTPEELYEKQSQDFLFVSENMPLYCNGTILKWKDSGKNVTENVLIGQKGDLNHDGDVNSMDAALLLSYVANVSVGNSAALYKGSLTNPAIENFMFYLMDIDTCSKTGKTDTASLNSMDAAMMLSYIANKSVGNFASWDSFMK